MESSDRTPNGDPMDPMDPAAQLALLDRVRNATEVEAWMPTTPLWHAPLLATTLAGAALLGSAPSPSWSVVGAILGGLALAVAVADMTRRRGAKPRWPRQPHNVLGFYAVIGATTLVLVSGWGALRWPSGTGAQVLLLAGAWLATTAVFTLGIWWTNRLRDRFAGIERGTGNTP